ncbi:unnamed protein product [Rotaria sp. Silwood2]|nr:unnamed protein product [Rotaria sp. Silwood2]CAF4232514.1 unnamed protein product [Rotaria sp. Silwood2]CAF4286866.1 unnamed protein product [Rotaria sp. Silwood2]
MLLTQSYQVAQVLVSTSEQYSCSLVGEIKLYLGKASCLPCTWMFCHGQTLSHTNYYLLFSVIGKLYGAGGGKTTFNLPDFRGRFPNTPTDQATVLEAASVLSATKLKVELSSTTPRPIVKYSPKTSMLHSTLGTAPV